MIRLENVNKTYPTRIGPVRILKDVNLVIRRGERVAFLAVTARASRR